jgi:hypothetical protein
VMAIFYFRLARTMMVEANTRTNRRNNQHEHL